MEGISLLCNLPFQPHSPLLASTIPCRYPKRSEIPLLFDKQKATKTSVAERNKKIFGALAQLVFNLQRGRILGVEFCSGNITSKENNGTLICCFKIVSKI